MVNSIQILTDLADLLEENEDAMLARALTRRLLRRAIESATGDGGAGQSSILLDESFSSGVTGWVESIGSLVHESAVEGPDEANGVMRLDAGVRAYKEFTAVESGKVRLTMWVYDNGSTVDGTTGNTLIAILPVGVGSLASANSAANFFLRRTSSGYVELAARKAGTSTTVAVVNLKRGEWHKVDLVLDVAARQFDLLVNDVLFEVLDSPNTTYASGVDTVWIDTASGGNSTYIDDMLLRKNYQYPQESTLAYQDFTIATGSLLNTNPTVYTRAAPVQPWKIADDTANWSGVTRDSGGAKAIDSTKPAVALTRNTADGVRELEFKTGATGTAYGAIMFNFYDNIDFTETISSGAGLFRLEGGTENNFKLIYPGSNTYPQTLQAWSFTPSSDTIYTLKVEKRGRFITCSYKQAAMDEGSYTVLGVHQITGASNGGRGNLSEEIDGLYFINGTDYENNRVRKWKFTGYVDPEEVKAVCGDLTVDVCNGQLRGFYHAGLDAPNRNLGDSKGLAQMGHRSRADMGNRYSRRTTVYNSTNVKSYRQKSQCLTEYQVLGRADVYATVFRNRVWVSDHLYTYDDLENFFPDLDLRTELWGPSYRYINASGDSAFNADRGYSSWTADVGALSLPAGYQLRTSIGSGDELRLTQVFALGNTAAAAATWNSPTKRRGDGDQWSIGVGIQRSNISADTDYRVARSFFFDIGASLSQTDHEAMTDDVDNPASFTMSTGTQKTNAIGDDDSDGFNERFGWYEINSSGNAVDLTNDSRKRHKPIFRLHGMTAAPSTITNDGVTMAIGTDYWVDDMGDGTYVVQFAGHVLANDVVTISAVSGTGIGFMAIGTTFEVA